MKFIASYRTGIYVEIVAANLSEAYDIAVRNLDTLRDKHKLTELHSIVRVGDETPPKAPNDPTPPPGPGGSGAPPTGPTPGTPTIAAHTVTDAVAKVA